MFGNLIPFIASIYQDIFSRMTNVQGRICVIPFGFSPFLNSLKIENYTFCSVDYWWIWILTCHLINDIHLIKNSNCINTYDYIQWKYCFALKYYCKIFWIWKYDFYIPFLLIDAYLYYYIPDLLHICFIVHFNFGGKVIFLPRRLLWL